MTEFEQQLLGLLDDIEMIATDELIISITQTRFDLAEEHGYSIEFESEPMSIH